MEKEGLQRVLNFLKQQGLTVEVLVTDRHRQINKWLRESHPKIIHYYDVWHVAKGMMYMYTTINNFYDIICTLGLRKKLEAAAKVKDCDIIGHWRRSIINHSYWCVASTSSGDGELIKAKWLSLDNHIHNVHKHKSRNFKKCAHGRLTGRDKNKKWFKRRKYCTLGTVLL